MLPLSYIKGPSLIDGTVLDNIITQVNSISGFSNLGVLPSSSPPGAGFAITSNYAGFGEVDFWNLVNNEDTNNEGFYFYQKITGGTAKQIASLFSTSADVTLQISFGNNVAGYTVNATEAAFFATTSIPFNFYVNAGLALTVTAAGRFILPFSLPPATAGAAGVQGTIAWDSGFIYVCVATNTWKRVAIATW